MKLLSSSLTQLCLYFATSIALLGNATASQAQVRTDGTVNTQVNQNGNVAEITGGQTSGGNLFHSFQDFSVNTGNEAFFNNAESIDNILSRVTGGNISNIDGLIRANGSANLFLINPAGIVFGDGASLNIGGSFYGSSATSILFEDGEFSAADLDNQPLLTVNAPIGLSFRDNPGDVSVSADGLFVNSGETLALLGGNVNFNGGIAGFAIANTINTTDPGVTLEVGGITEAGTVAIEANDSLSFPDNTARGDVSITNNSFLTTTSSEAGAINIYARNFDLNTDSRITNGIFSNSGNANAQAGDITINATGNVVLDGEGSVRFPIAERTEVAIRNNVFPSGVGNAGDINISANNISLLNAAEIGSSLANQGSTGNINLNAIENILIDGASITNEITEDARGNVGDINITANTFDTLNPSIALESINSVVSGVSDNTGNISITAEVFNHSGTIVSEVSGMGNSSDIIINVNNAVSLTGDPGADDPGLIQTTVEGEAVGNSGSIEIQTTDLSLTSPPGIQTQNAGEGDGGNVNITADDIVVDNSQVSTNSDATIFTELFDLFGLSGSNIGNGGDINISANSLSVLNGGDINASAEGMGDGGDINIVVRDRILNNGRIRSDVGFVSTDSNGNGGNITIDTSNLRVNGTISASTFAQGNAGNTIINATEAVEVENGAVIANQALFSSTGNAGNLTIETTELSVNSGGLILVNTLSGGNAGNLTIRATNSIDIRGMDEDNFRSGLFVNAQNEDGSSGELNIFTQNLTVADGAAINVGNFPNSEASFSDPGTGEPGNLNIQADSLNVESGGSITAATQSLEGEGANINLQADTINLRDGGLISAEALNEGNGGNLNIDTNFIVAFPDGNNDIIASAEQGEGGNISINAESLLGIQERALSSATNDINASSQVSGLDGTISITTPDLNPVRGATELPNNVIETGETTAQSCRANREVAAQGGLTIGGKGGIVPAPDLPLSSQNALVNGETSASESREVQSVATSYGKIVPARGVEINADGEVILTAHASKNQQRSYKGSLNCGN